ncbi:MAG: formylglycine-generating enzyme family protein [bacterium]
MKPATTFLLICLFLLPVRLCAQVVESEETKILSVSSYSVTESSADVSSSISRKSTEYYKDMAVIPVGEFLMGSPDDEGFPNEHPRHKVYLDAFFIDKYELSGAKYRIFAQATGRKMPRQPCADKDNCPVVYVNWNDAQACCEYYGKRLPTEAEWEKAARGRTDAKYSFGDNEKMLGVYAWYWGNSGTKVHPVGGKKTNKYGLYDMHGNVLEWVADWYDDKYYETSPGINPKGAPDGREKVVRGGSAFVSAPLCRSAIRMRSSPDNLYSGRSFRCAVSVIK